MHVLTFLIILLGLFLTSPPQAGATPSTLKSCDMDGWSGKRLPNRHSLRFLKTDEGCFAAFRISPWHDQISEGWRAELEDPLRLAKGSTASYEFSTFLPKSLQGGNKPALVLAQWHDNKPASSGAQRPPLSLRLRGDNFVIPLFNQNILHEDGFNSLGRPLYTAPAVYNRWITWRIRAYWALDATGLIEVWRDGELIVRYRGLVGYPTDLTAPYFKLGIYTTQSFDRELKVYHTGFKRTFMEPNKDPMIRPQDR